MTLTPFRRPKRLPSPAARPPGQKMRRIGTGILIAGFSSAAALYWLETRRAGPSMEELLPGYSKANTRLMGIYYGHAGKMMWEWREALARPDVQAILIVVATLIAAAVCFRMAWLDAEGVRPGSDEGQTLV